MILLDENIPDDQRDLLAQRRIRFRELGRTVGRVGLTDQEIIPLLLQLKSVTFFTLDHDFYKPRLCHSAYCLAYLDVLVTEAAQYIRRFLRHPSFNTQAKRLGRVVRLQPTKLQMWQAQARQETELFWPVK